MIIALKTSPAIHEQRKQLERAKTGDLLKAKIQQRPNRQELERRHILEHDESHVDPSLAEKQRMLKKARLADQLNSQISHRPGPLELIKKNILHVEEPIERIVKEGLVSFKATSEGLLNRPQHPNSYVTYEDDSQNSSESGDQRTSPKRSDVLEMASAPTGIVTVALTIPTSGGAVVVTSGPILQTSPTMAALVAVPPSPPPLPIQPMPIKLEVKPEPVISETPQRFAELCQSVVGTMAPSPTLVPIHTAPSTFSFGSPAFGTLSPITSTTSLPTFSCRPNQSTMIAKFDAPGKDKYRKKNKCKPTTKARPIKFHEYKGPPNAQKSSSMSQSQTEETSYQLLLKQQNFLLEYLEGLHKQPSGAPAQPPTPQILMMTETNFVQKPSFATICHNTNSPTTVSITSLAQQQAPSTSTFVATSCGSATTPDNANQSLIDLNKLEKMKVSDLKIQLKKRNLPVSGPKPQLIERLKPFLPLSTVEKPVSIATGDAGELGDFDALNSPHLSMSPASEYESMDVQQVDSPLITYAQLSASSVKEDLVREQQRKIDELQRKLKESQEELLQMKQNHTAASQMIQSREQPVNQKLIFKQQLEAKIQKEKMLQIENLQRQQKEYLANQQLVLKNVGTVAKTTKTMSGTKSTAVLISTPLPSKRKEETPALAFNENALQQLANKKNLEIVWNGEQALLLVGLPKTEQDDNNNQLRNIPQRTASMPGFLLPIQTSGQTVSCVSNQTSGNQLLLQNKIQVQQKPYNQDDTQNKSEINAENLSINDNLKPKIAIQTGKPKRVHRNSQIITDVLEILIRNGDLPESAAQVPVTPTTGSLPSSTGHQIPFSGVSAKTATESEQNVLLMHTEPVSPAPSTCPTEYENYLGTMDISSMLSKVHENTEFIPDAVSRQNNINSQSLTEGDHKVENEFLVTKTLDMLLNGHREEDQSLRRDGNGCIALGANDIVLNSSVRAPKCPMETNGNGTTEKLLSGNSCPTEEMDHFDEYEFMTLMKLDMEIGDDSSYHLTPNTASDTHNLPEKKCDTKVTADISHGSQMDRENDQSQTHTILSEFGVDLQELGLPSNSNGMESDRGETPSQRIVQENEHEGHYDNNGNQDCSQRQHLNLINNNHFADDTPMDIEVFSNSLSAFDFPFVVNDGQSGTMSSVSRTGQDPQNIGVVEEGAEHMRATPLFTGMRMDQVDVHNSVVKKQSNSSRSSNDLLSGFRPIASATVMGNCNSNMNSVPNVVGSINPINDQLEMADEPPSLLYDSHLPIGHDYGLELFDDLRIPAESMSWNEVDFPIYGK